MPAETELTSRRKDAAHERNSSASASDDDAEDVALMPGEGGNAAPAAAAATPATRGRKVVLTASTAGLLLLIVAAVLTYFTQRTLDSSLPAAQPPAGGGGGEGEGSGGDSGSDSGGDKQMRVESSASDPRAYRWLQLANGLRVLLVRDGDSSAAAAAMAVGVGSLQDPRGRFDGLAHLLEHMLFLGTAKYVEPNGFNAYLAAHGGGSNAYTDLEHTVYYFSVDAPALAGAADRFSQFFAAPLFTASLTDREMQAVDSEHRKNLNSDGWRLFQLLKELSSADTPFHGFSTGHLGTLNRTGVRPALLAFHAAHYAAGNMRLVLVGPQPLGELEALARECFSGIPAEPRDPVALTLALAAQQAAAAQQQEQDDSSNSTVDSIAVAFAGVSVEEMREAASLVASAAAAAAPSRLGPDAVYPPATGRSRFVALQPVAHTHSLTFAWPLPSVSSTDAGRVGAAAFLGSVLGDEGEGSLLQYLKAAGVAEAVTAGLDLDTAGFAMFSVTVELNPLALAEAVAAAEAAAAASGSSGSSGEAEAAVAAARGQALFKVLDQVHTALGVALDQLDAALVEAVKYGATALVAAGGFGSAQLGLLPEDLQPYQRLSQRDTTPQPPTAPPPYTRDGDDSTGELLSWPGLESQPAYRLWRESLQRRELAYRYPDRAPAADLATALSRAMHTAGPADILSPPSRRVWQPLHALRLVRRLDLEASLAIFVSSEVERLLPHLLTATEPIYGSRYGAVSFTDMQAALRMNNGGGGGGRDDDANGGGSGDDSQAAAAAALHLPPPNPYLPASFALPTIPPQHAAVLGLPPQTQERPVWAEVRQWQEPVLVDVSAVLQQEWATAASAAVAAAAAGAGGAAGAAAVAVAAAVSAGPPPVTVWWAPDAYFQRPYLHVDVELVQPLARASPALELMTLLHLATLEDATERIAYNAAKAGGSASVDVAPVAAGIWLHLAGYTDKVGDLLSDYLGAVAAGGADPSQDRAAAQLLALAQAVANERLDQPYKRALEWHKLLLGKTRWDAAARLRAAAELAGQPTDTHEAGGEAAAATAAERAHRGLQQVSDPAAVRARLIRHAAALASNVTSISVLVYGAAGIDTVTEVARAVVRHAFTQALAGAAATATAAAAGAATAAGGGGDVVGSLPQVGSLPLGSHVFQRRVDNPRDPNSAVVLLHQIGLRDGCGSDRPQVVIAADGSRQLGHTSTATARQAQQEAEAEEEECELRAVTAAVLGKLLYEPAFDVLRTQQQLGYIVSGGLFSMSTAAGAGGGRSSVPVRRVSLFYGADDEAAGEEEEAGQLRVQQVQVAAEGDVMMYLMVLVQGQVQPAHVLDERASAFLSSSPSPTANATAGEEEAAAAATTFGGFLRSLTQEQLDAVTSALAAQYSRAPTSMAEARGWIADETLGHTHTHSRRARAAAALTRLTPSHLLQLYSEILNTSSGSIRRLSVEVFGSEHDMGAPAAGSAAAAVRVTLPESQLQPPAFDV